MSCYNARSSCWGGGTQEKTNALLSNRWPLVATFVKGLRKALGLLGVGG